MYRIAYKPIRRCDVGEVTLDFLTDFYKQASNHDVVLILYNGQKLVTLISYNDYIHLKDETQVLFYIKGSNNNLIWDSFTKEEIEKAFNDFPTLNYLILEIYNSEGYFACRVTNDIECRKITSVLKSKCVQVYCVNIPGRDDITNNECHGDGVKYGLWEYYKFISNGELEPPWYINKITNIKITSDTKICNFHGSKLGNSDKKIYLVGACITGGWTNQEKESLPELLYQKIVEEKLDYELVPIEYIVTLDTDISKILTYDIKKNDIVIIINYDLFESDLDTTNIYNTYKGDKWLYQGVLPIHTSVTGNELIADAMVDNIIKPAYEKCFSNDEDCVLYHGEPQFSINCEWQIKEYIDKIKKIRIIPQDAVIGAIVMNCNPFTYGHRHLVEYASAQVDFLYIFVVEEDLSTIPFTDRMFLIYESVKDISNIVIVPSGNFIISKNTFYNYFEKESNVTTIKVDEDIHIFAKYIAKGLQIKKRFVGEEPFDQVTACYNKKMKEIFPQYGLELIIIPRKILSDGTPISATSVRKLLVQKDWDVIADLVPPTTLHYLKENQDIILNRNVIRDQTTPIQLQIQNLVHTICNLDKVVLYTVGKYTELLMSMIPQNVADKLVFCDKAAITQKIFFHNKLVEPPDKLLSQYRDYNIVIPSAIFAKEIFEEFLQMGIDMGRCFFNTYLLL